VRRRLTLLVTATMCLVLVAFLVPLAVLLRTVAADRATASAATNVQGLVAAAGTAPPDALGPAAEQVAASSRLPVTVFLADGRVLGTPVGRSTAVDLAARRNSSLTVATGAGREIVVAVQGRAEGTAVVRTFVSAEQLTAGVTRSWLVLAALGLALLLLGLLVADRLARTLVRPITDLSAVSYRLARAELTARATPDGPPELREVAGALNLLAGRIQDLLKEEREHVADLSHRLRTPLTSLRLEAEALADPAEAARIGAGVDGLERAVTGLILQARRQTESTGPGECDAAPVVRERVEFWTVLAEDTGRTVTLDLADGPLPVRVAADDLAAALDALLGNVFAHTPDGTPFAVTLAPGRPGAVLTITDEGPGIPAAHVERGASGGGSTGLGLDIARRAARASGGDLTVRRREPGGGTVVTLRLG
jgi:signal transduction histidine kinase